MPESTDEPDATRRQSAAESAIRDIVAAQAAAWDSGDGEAYSRHVAPNVSFTNIFGTVIYGTAAFVERHRQILATFYRGTTKRQVIRRIRFVTPDVAVVDVANEVHGVTAMPAGMDVPPDGVVRTELMQVFVSRNGKWTIEAYHNVPITRD